MKITLAKTMKYRNRVAEKLGKVSEDMQEHNSILAANEPEVDIKRLDGMRHEIMEHLIAVKTMIHTAGQPIRSQIFRMSELRAAVGFYKSLSTRHGKAQSSRWNAGDELIEYKATLRKDDVDKIVAGLEEDIDKLQDELDSFNHETKIDVEVPEVINRPFASTGGDGDGPLCFIKGTPE